jgi:hypothetical protein
VTLARKGNQRGLTHIKGKKSREKSHIKGKKSREKSILGRIFRFFVRREIRQS